MMAKNNVQKAVYYQHLSRLTRRVRLDQVRALTRVASRRTETCDPNPSGFATCVHRRTARLLLAENHQQSRPLLKTSRLKR